MPDTFVFVATPVGGGEGGPRPKTSQSLTGKTLVSTPLPTTQPATQQWYPLDMKGLLEKVSDLVNLD